MHTDQIIVLVIVVVVGLGAVESLLVYLDRRRYPPPGTLVDIGGRRLHLLCMGSSHDGPSVILEAGSLGFSVKWDMVQQALSRFSRVYSYDRAGYGWSDAVELPRTDRSGKRVVEELHTMLVNAHVPPPYILVGHDIGGQYVRQFARCYPELVAGMVLVDSFHRYLWSARESMVQQVRSARMMSFIGLIRLENWLRYRDLPMSQAAKGASIGLHMRGLQNSASWELISLEAEEEFVGLLGAKPVVVLSQYLLDKPYAEDWEKAQEDFLRLSSNSHLTIAKHSGHLIHLEEPELIVKAIQQIVETVCADTAQPTTRLAYGETI